MRADRRRFVLGLAAASGSALALPRAARAARSAAPRAPRQALYGTQFDLDVRYASVDLTGRPRTAMLVNGSLPGPILHWREGDVVTLRVTNRLDAPTSIHWHGVLVPTGMDGVPGISYRGIFPGETFVYRFPVRQSGTFWYHSHSHFQEQNCVTGALVIHPREPDPVRADRDYVVQLNDWTDEDPEQIFYHLKADSGYYNYHKRTVADFFRDIDHRGLVATLRNRWAWDTMRMDPRDIADVSGAMTGGTYTFLINGQSPAANWTGLFKPGERVRLRFINSSAMSYFDVRIPGLKMTVVAADGCNVEPVPVDEFRIGVAETYDVIVTPREEAYTIFAQAMDRSGFARGTLAVRPGLAAAVPPMDPVFSRTMVDMGMAGMGMGHMEGMDGKAATAGTAVRHQDRTSGTHGMRSSGRAGDVGGMSDMSDMGDMGDMGGMGGMVGMGMAASDGSMGAMHQGARTTTSGMSMQTLMRASKPGPPNATGQTAYPQPQDVHLEVGPQVVHLVEHPTQRLDRAGDGLDGNGRDVLTYARLVRLAHGPQNAPFVTREPDADVVLHLTGNMQRYIFGFNGLTFDQSEPVRLPHGQRIRVTLINDTMMEHPIHLHGMFTELDNHRGRLRPLKHTVSVKPAEFVQYYVNATEVGRWAYHCHMLYHMEAGMFTSAVVA